MVILLFDRICFGKSHHLVFVYIIDIPGYAQLVVSTCVGQKANPNLANKYLHYPGKWFPLFDINIPVFLCGLSPDQKESQVIQVSQNSLKSLSNEDFCGLNYIQRD